MIKTDVLIIGGGPAGSSCAWHLNRSGINCLIVDRQSFPRQKLCAGWIQPEVFSDLEVDPSDYPYGLMTFPSLQVSLYGKKLKIPTKQYAIRRYEFDKWLLDRSEVSLEKHDVKHIKSQGDIYIVDEKYQCKYLVGAGGTNCPVYRSIFRSISPRNEDEMIIALEEEFQENYKDSKCYLWFLENQLPGYSWYVPKRDNYLNIGVGGVKHKLQKNNDSIKFHWEYLIQKLDQLSLVPNRQYKPEGYAYYHRGNHIKVQNKNAFIVGDAAALATIDMGEGIGPAIKSGLLAAEAIITGNEYSVDKISKYSIKYRWLVRTLDLIFSKLRFR
jgi:flavin-dependent dehydrogenase